MDLLREHLHSGFYGLRLRFQQRGIHEFETFGSPNHTFLERVLAGPWNGVPARDLSAFRRSCSTPCQAVRSASFLDEFCEGRVVESGVTNVMRLESAAADATP